MTDASAARYGRFAGKWAFASGPRPGMVYFLSSMGSESGDDEVLMAAMSAADLGKTESVIVYQVAGGLRLQLGNLLWLTKEDKKPLIYLSDDFAKASLFEADLSSAQSDLRVRTGEGMRTIYYSLDQTTPYLSVLGPSHALHTFYLTRITPSLDDITKNKGCPGGNFADVDVAGERLNDLDLTKADFSSANLSNASFAGSNVTSCNMKAATLLGVSFEKARLDHADLTACKLTGTDWGKPQSAAGINLSGCRADRATLGHRGFPLDCRKAILSGGMFHQAHLEEWDLSEANLTHAVLAEAVLDKAKLDEATVHNGVFTGAKLRGASLKKIGAHGANFIRAVLDGADLSGGKFGKEDKGGPSNPNGMPAVFAGASCTEAVATGADFYGVNLQGMNGKGAHFEQATLDNANLSQGLWAFANFTQARVSGADFTGSVLTGAKFNGCVIGAGSGNQSCSFQRALLQSVRFEQATLSGVLLTGGEISEAGGVPLFQLSLADEAKLTQDHLGQLKPQFSQAGNPLGSDATIQENASWEIDNSEDPDIDAPGGYFVNSDLEVFDSADRTTRLFAMEPTDQSLLDTATASHKLQHIFKEHGYSLAKDAPITRSSSSWQIESSRPEDFRGAFYYPLMRVYRKSGCLAVYGAERVLLRDWKEAYPGGIGFQATAMTPDQLSENSIGPRGYPRILVGKNRLTWQEYLTSMDRKP